MRFYVWDKDGIIADNDGPLIAEALFEQLTDAAAVWGVTNVQAVGLGASLPRPGDIPLIVTTDVVDAQNDLGWHEYEGAVPFAKVFAPVIYDNNGGVIHSNSGLTLSSVLSHEMLEILVNPQAVQFMPIGKGRGIALEICDPVEGDWYSATNGVYLSNWVFPGWFDASDTTFPYDKLRTCQAPLTLRPGGYGIYREANGQFNSVFGQHVNAYRRALRPWSREAQMRRQNGLPTIVVP